MKWTKWAKADENTFITFGFLEVPAVFDMFEGAVEVFNHEGLFLRCPKSSGATFYWALQLGTEHGCQKLLGRRRFRGR